ncbi:MAG: hypothetical protein OXR73_22015 [Myxococcales bacterium]|nr:hypothetical protein [Myxococcales bacterium]
MIVVATCLDPDAAGADTFLADLGSMLEKVCSLARIPYEAVALPGASRRLRVPDFVEPPACLLREVGIHRAQMATAPNGRIISHKVQISLIRSAGQLQSSEVIRTYNYPVGSVTFHADGSRHPIEEVLNGDAPPRDPPHGAA